MSFNYPVFNYHIVLRRIFNTSAHIVLLITLANCPAFANSLLNETIPEHQQHWLNVSEHKVLSIYLEEETGTAYGGALIIPDLKEHPASRGISNNIRTALAAKKWHTLALELTDIDPNDNQLNSDIIQAGLELLNSKGIYNIVIIGKGTGASHAIHYLAESAKNNNPLLASVRALVTIDVNHSALNSTINTLEQISALSTVYLDAYTSNNQQQQLLAKSRRQAARHLISADRQQSKYNQLKLPPQIDSYSIEENLISKRIRGWLNKNIAGFIIKN